MSLKHLLVFMLGLLWLFAEAAELTLAENGKSDYVIVYPDGCSKEYLDEIRVFKDFMKEMTGVDYKMLPSAEWKEGTPAIALGDTAISRAAGIDPAKLKHEEYIVRTVGKNLILSGRPYSGPLFAAYDFMEKCCGCRWYDDFYIVIPKHSTLKIKEQNIDRCPSFQSRRIFTGGGVVYYKSGPYHLPFSQKSTYLRIYNEAYGRPGDIHTFWLYTKNWPKDNLKLLSMTPEGKRRLLRGHIGPNFCLTNPEGFDLFVKSLRGYIEQDMKEAAKHNCDPPFIYNLSQNDVSKYLCHCPDCDAITAKYGESGLLIHFINRVARNIARDYPHVVIQTAAYEFTRPCPIGDIHTEPNVSMELSHTKGNYYSKLKDDKVPIEFFDGWSKFSDSLSAWDYWIFYWDATPAPYHNLYQIQDDIKFYYDRKVRFLRIESEDPVYSNFFQLKRYLGYKLMDDVNADANAIIQDFLEGYYGPAAPEIKEFIDLTAKGQEGHYAAVFSKEKPEEKNGRRPWLDHDYFAKAEDIFNRAEAKCTPGSVYLRNVHRERIPVDIAQLTWYSLVKPQVSRDVIIDRYTANFTEQVNLRMLESARGQALLKLKNDMDAFRKADEIELKKNGPKPRLSIPRAPAWGSTQTWTANNGLPNDRNIVMKANLDGNDLNFVFIETGIKGELKSGSNIWDADDLEIMLADDRGGEYFQLLVAPNGKFYSLLYDKADGPDKLAAPWLKVQSRVTGGTWEVRITIPMDKLPLKGVRCGNFFRGHSHTASAWSPTYTNYFTEVSAFGDISLEK